MRPQDGTYNSHLEVRWVYKASHAEEGSYDLILVADHMLEAIVQIEKLMSGLKDYAQFERDMVTPFPQEQCFVFTETLKLSFEHAEVAAAHDVVRQRLAGSDKGFVFSCPEMLAHAAPHSSTTIRVVHSPMELELYVQKHKLRIVKDLMSYALQLRMADEVAGNPTLRMALELFVVRVVPFLRFALVRKLPGFGDRLKKLELRFYRNFLEHGSIFVDEANLPPEEFLIRYLSVLLNEFKPILQMLRPHLAQDIFVKTIYAGVLKFTTADFTQFLSQRDTVRCSNVIDRGRLAAVYDFAITDCGAAGDCLFRAVATQVGANAELGTTGDVNTDNVILRQLAVAVILAQREVLGDLFYDKRLIMPSAQEVTVRDCDTYARLMGMNGTWGGQIEVFVLARLLGRPLVLFGPNIRPQVFEGNAAGEPLFLYYEGNHYQMVKPNLAAPRVLLQRVVDELSALSAPGGATAGAAGAAPLAAPLAGPALFAPVAAAAAVIPPATAVADTLAPDNGVGTNGP